MCKYRGKNQKLVELILLNWNILTGACQVLVLDMFPRNRLVSIKLFFWWKSVLFISCRCNKKFWLFYLLYFSNWKLKKKTGIAITMVKYFHLCCSKVNNWGQILLYARAELHLPGLDTLQSQKENSCYLVRFTWEFLSSGEAFGPQCTWKSAARAQHSWAVWQGKGWDEGNIGSSWPAPPWCRQSLLVSPSFENNIIFYDFHGSWCRSLFIKYSSRVWGQKWKI